MKKTIAIIPASMLLCLLAFPITSASAQLSSAQLEKLVFATRTTPPSTNIKAQRAGEQVLIELRGGGFGDLWKLKTSAFTIGRSLLRSDPGYIRGVITRFYMDNGGSYVDVIVTGKDVVGVDAGIESKENVLKRIPLTEISFSESGHARYSKYLSVADRLRENGDIYAAQNYYYFALNQDKASANRDPRFIKGLFELGRAFDMRQDIGQVDLAYGQILDITSNNPNSSSLEILRQVASHFKNQGDFQRAAQAAELVVKIQESGNNSLKNRGYVKDVRTLAMINLELGKVAEAKQALEGVLLVSRNRGGEKNPNVALILEDLGDCYSKEGKVGAAYDFYKRAKRRYDSSMAARQQHLRVDYEVYRSAMKRLKDKMRLLGKTS